MAKASLKKGKTVIKLTMGPKEAQVIQALVANTAENMHAYEICGALDAILGYDDLPEVTVRTEDGHPVINVEQR